MSYHQCYTFYGGVRLFAPHKLPYCAWRKGKKNCWFAPGWWCEVITKGLCEPNSILPLPMTRSTNKLGTSSHWQIWAQFQVAALKYHKGKWCGSYQSYIWMPTIGTPRNTKLSIWGSKLYYCSGGNKFLEIFVCAKPPPSQWNRGATSSPVSSMFAH
jgi:hypothetical protein